MAATAVDFVDCELGAKLSRWHPFHPMCVYGIVQPYT